MKTTERTERRIERPRVERVERSTAARPWVIAAVAAALALVVGFGAGFLVWDSDDPGPSEFVSVGGTELTDRQEDMKALLDDYVVAWQRGDGAAVAALFTDNGTLEILGSDFPVEDGSLAGYVDRNPAPTLEPLEPVLVDGNRALMFHHIDGMGTLSNVFVFTSTGEVLISNHEIMN